MGQSYSRLGIVFWPRSQYSLSFYEKVLDALILHLPSRFPMEEGEDEKKYIKAIKAKAFDVARGFLPAGVTTYISWHTNLRQAADHLKEMRHHPLEEVRNVAKDTLAGLRQKYPDSFSHKTYAKEEIYLAKEIPPVAYYDFARYISSSAYVLCEKLSGYFWRKPAR